MEPKLINDFQSREQLFEWLLTFIQKIDDADYPLANRVIPLKKKYKPLLEDDLSKDNTILGIKIYFIS